MLASVYSDGQQSLDRHPRGGVCVAKDQHDSSDQIRKRTPLEQAIAEKTDRRRRYDAKMERQGFKRTTIYVRADRLEEVKAFIQRVNETSAG